MEDSSFDKDVTNLPPIRFAGFGFGGAQASNQKYPHEKPRPLLCMVNVESTLPFLA